MLIKCHYHPKTEAFPHLFLKKKGLQCQIKSLIMLMHLKQGGDFCACAQYCVGKNASN